MNLEHVAVNVPDARAMCPWYAKHFDLEIVLANDTTPFIHFLSDAGGSMIEMYSNPIAAHFDFPEVNPYNLHLAFSTADIESDIARLTAAGAVQYAAVETTPRGDLLVFMRDPWGMPFQLAQRSSPLR